MRDAITPWYHSNLFSPVESSAENLQHFQLIWTNYHPSLWTSEEIISVLQVGKRCARISAKSDPDGGKIWLYCGQKLDGEATNTKFVRVALAAFFSVKVHGGTMSPCPPPHPLSATGSMLRINGFCENVLPSLTHDGQRHLYVHNSCHLPCNQKICRAMKFYREISSTVITMATFVSQQL